MGREPGPIVLRLSVTQYNHLVKSNVNGGQLTMKNNLMERFEHLGAEGYRIELLEAEVGKLLHQMHGEGGWQDALRRAFRQSLERYLGWL